MRNSSLASTLGHLGKAVIVSSLLMLPFTGTYAGASCCSQHGGVTKCNTATGHQLCKDGTDSPTCMCKKATETPKAKSQTSTKATTKSNTSSKKTPTTSDSSTGCCSNHGGIDHCNKTKGVQMCKDGTASPSCACH